MARRRPLFGRARRAGRRLFAATRRASRRLARRRGRQRAAMGIVGKIGSVVALTPLILSVTGVPGKLSGLYSVWKAGGSGADMITGMLDTLAIQYVGRKVDGTHWGGPEAYSGWTWLGYGAAMMLGDALAGRVIRRLGVRSARLPLVGRVVSG